MCPDAALRITRAAKYDLVAPGQTEGVVCNSPEMAGRQRVALGISGTDSGRTAMRFTMSGCVRSAITDVLVVALAAKPHPPSCAQSDAAQV